MSIASFGMRQHRSPLSLAALVFASGAVERLRRAVPADWHSGSARRGTARRSGARRAAGRCVRSRRAFYQSIA
jgi:hypothetical protein